jgi:hypothetical protein
MAHETPGVEVSDMPGFAWRVLDYEVGDWLYTNDAAEATRWAQENAAIRTADPDYHELL